MAYNPFSDEHDFAKLYAVGIRYSELPRAVNDQRALIRIFHHSVYQDGKQRDIADARKIILMRVAQKLYVKSKKAYASLIPRLSGAEKYFISKLRAGICEFGEKRANIEEKIAILLENCSEAELRPDVRGIADVLLPAKAIPIQDFKNEEILPF